LPYRPSVSLFIMSLIFLVASSSVSSAVMVTISCSGVSSYTETLWMHRELVQRRSCTFLSFINCTKFCISASRSFRDLVLYHWLCQKPWQVRFLKMKLEVGIDKGCFAIAPYETRWASSPRRRTIRVVSLPPILQEASMQRITVGIDSSYRHNSDLGESAAAF
jgi:hypothetical protein